jgi:hypothetical protein
MTSMKQVAAERTARYCRDPFGPTDERCCRRVQPPRYGVGVNDSHGSEEALTGGTPHVNAWRLAGFSVGDLIPGREVTFVRTTASTGPVEREARHACCGTDLHDSVEAFFDQLGSAVLCLFV